MNTLIIFSIIILTFLRIINILFSLDMYLNKRDFKFKIFTYGWLLWTISGICALLSTFSFNRGLMDFLLVSNAVLSASSIICFLWGFLSFYFKVSKKVLAYLSYINLIMGYLLFIFMNTSIAITFVFLFFYFLVMGVFIFVLTKLKKLQKENDKNTLWFYYLVFISSALYLPIGFLIFLRGYSYGLYDSNDFDLIVLNYGYAVILTFLLMLLGVHLEYKVSSVLKNELKDKYSHNLGNALHSIYNAINLLDRTGLSKEDIIEIRDILKNKEEEASRLLNEIREL